MTDHRLKSESIARRGKYDLRAAVTPGFGANLVSFTVDGQELIHWDPKRFQASGSLDDLTGAFNMFPTPCRLAGASYPFEGRTIRQRKAGKDVFIHGLVRDEAFEYRNEGHAIESSLTIAPGTAVHEGFPFCCRFTVRHALHEAGLAVTFRLENQDKCNIPFGYGIHSFWKLHGQRRDFAVRVPCDDILDLADLVPTGGTTPVAGTKLDLRQLTHMEGVFIDNAFWERKPGATAEVLFGAIGKRMTIAASDNFPHMIVYAPEGKPFVCVENLTTCPNAPNLIAAGKGKVTNMLIASPGRTVEGTITYTIANA